ncbi:hypothetical protein AAE478_008948 [Parahypoxylon ruwenzoriense]
MGLITCFALLSILCGISTDYFLGPRLAVQILGSIILCASTSIFGICWLTTVWLIPTEIYPSSARARGGAVSVIVWGLTNFIVTLLTPIGFNNLKYRFFLVFAVTNMFAGWWTWRYLPETGGRSFEENQKFFASAQDDDTWVVKKVDRGRYLGMPPEEENVEHAGHTEHAGHVGHAEDVQRVKGKSVSKRKQVNEATPLLGPIIEEPEPESDRSSVD